MNSSKVMLSIFVLLGIMVAVVLVTTRNKDAAQKEEDQAVPEVHLTGAGLKYDAAEHEKAAFRGYISDHGDVPAGDIILLLASGKFESDDDFLIAFQTQCKDRESRLQACDKVYVELASLDSPDSKIILAQQFGPAFQIANLEMTGDGLKWDEISSPRDKPKLAVLTVNGRKDLTRAEWPWSR